MKKPVLIGIVFVIVILGVLIYSTMNLAQKRVEVCMAYNGQAKCSTASGSSEDYAMRSAVNNACAQIASGVTETMQCENSRPTKVTWLK